MKGRDASEICSRCHAQRERHVDHKTGQYHVSIPSKCDDKDRCEREIMRGYEIANEAKR